MNQLWQGGLNSLMPGRTNRRLALLVALCLMGAGASKGSTASAQDAEKTCSTPLGIAMEEYPYPHPVQFFSLEIEGQPLRMAYMDVRATSADNGRAVVLFHGKNFYGSYFRSRNCSLSLP